MMLIILCTNIELEYRTNYSFNVEHVPTDEITENSNQVINI